MTAQSTCIRYGMIVGAIALGATGAGAGSDPHAVPVTAETVLASPLTVAVIGDGFGEALDEGLRDDLGQDGGYAIVSATHAPFGLATDQRFDWSATIRTLIAHQHIDAAVVMLGANDARPIRDGTAVVDPDTPRWASLYGDRVGALVETLRSAGAAVTWVGLPIVADDATASAYAAINEVVHDRAIKAGARYVDSWAAFADEGGRFSPDGPDRNGRQVRLRLDDGRDFTHDGSAKLASFVEGDLKRQRDQAVAAVVASTNVVLPREPAFDNDVNAQIRRELGLPALAPSVRNITGAVELIGTPPVAVDGQLVAATIGPAQLPNAGGMSAGQRALVEGRPVPPKAGRIDDFSWPRR